MAQKTKKSGMFIATDSGAAEVDGRTVIFVKDKTRVRGGDPLLKAAGHCFEPIGDYSDDEQATAGPGESRRR